MLGWVFVCVFTLHTTPCTDVRSFVTRSRLPGSRCHTTVLHNGVTRYLTCHPCTAPSKSQIDLKKPRASSNQLCVHEPEFPATFTSLWRERKNNCTSPKTLNFSTARPLPGFFQTQQQTDNRVPVVFQMNWEGGKRWGKPLKVAKMKLSSVVSRH